MPEVSVRRLVGDDIVKYYAPLHQYAFSSTPPIDTERYANRPQAYQDSLVMGLFEDEKIAATILGLTMTENVRGKIVPMVGIAGITSDPTARRKGYVRRLVNECLRYFYEQDFPVATLYPFRESFYERMGFVSFTQNRRITYPATNLAPFLKLDLSGQVEYMTLQEGWDIHVDFLRQQQTRTHGMGMFNVHGMDFMRELLNYWLAVAYDDDDNIIGTMLYKITGFRDTFEVQHFLTRNSHARYLFLNWIARHIDQVNEVDMKLLPTERPETWFADMDVKANPDIWITPLGRVLNVRRLDGLAVGSGDLCVEITDDQCAWNNGIFTFTAADGVLSVSEGGTPQCTLTIQGLSALIYGTHNPQDFQFRSWGTPSDEVQSQMRALFPYQTPHLYAVF